MIRLLEETLWTVFKRNHPHRHEDPVVIDLLAAGRHVKQRGGTGGSNLIDVERACSHNLAYLYLYLYLYLEQMVNMIT